MLLHPVTITAASRTRMTAFIFSFIFSFIFVYRPRHDQRVTATAVTDGITYRPDSYKTD